MKKFKVEIVSAKYTNDVCLVNGVKLLDEKNIPTREEFDEAAKFTDNLTKRGTTVEEMGQAISKIDKDEIKLGMFAFICGHKLMANSREWRIKMAKHLLSMKEGEPPTRFAEEAKKGYISATPAATPKEKKEVKLVADIIGVITFSCVLYIMKNTDRMAMELMLSETGFPGF